MWGCDKAPKVRSWDSFQGCMHWYRMAVVFPASLRQDWFIQHRAGAISITHLCKWFQARFWISGRVALHVFPHLSVFSIGFSFFVNVYIWSVMINFICQIRYLWLRVIVHWYKFEWASHMVLVVKNPPANEGDGGLIPELGRSPRGGHGTPLQSSYQENPVDRGAWQVPVHRVAKSPTWLKRHAHARMHTHTLLSKADCLL